MKQRIRRGTARIVVAIGLALCAARASWARLLPGFSVELAWAATDIVEVLETDQPGQFKIVENWKGTLPLNTVIDVPDMIPLQSGPDRSLNGEKDQKIRSGRLVLFLQEEATSTGNNRGWVPVSPATFGEFRMKTSMAWLQDSRAICFGPDFSQSTLVLQDCGMSETQLRMAVQRVDHGRTLLELIKQISDKRARAEELAPFVTSQHRAARSFVFKELEACGEDALPTLLAMLHDPALLDRHGETIAALVAIEGQRAGPELVASLESDVRFWTALRPTLKPGWWYENNDATPERYLPRRYSRTIDLIRALDSLKYPGARESVIALRDLWKSLPPMDNLISGSDKSGENDQMIQECNHLLNRLPSP